MIAAFQADAIPDEAVWIALVVVFLISLFCVWVVYRVVRKCFPKLDGFLF